jgi:Na+/H+ antiporter NhaD/arsenite permease-like protein
MHLDSHALSQLQTLAGYAIFLGSYLVFALGKFPGMKIDRPGAAIIGAVLLFALGIVGPLDALHSVDFSTLVLLFSMMLIVARLHLAGFFEWVADLLARHFRPAHLLPMVIVTSGLLSAFFVNDIICLVMVPFVLGVTRRMRVRPLPFLLALATASNIGSVATVTGNPQNMLIGSSSGIGYRDFFWHLAPVAIMGLFVDWAVLHFMFGKEHADAPLAEVPLRHRPFDHRNLRKPLLVIAMVLVGFFLGIPPALIAALGAALMLITRTVEPRKIYDEVDWGLLVFFVGLFIIVGGAEKAGIIGQLLALTRIWNLHRMATFTVVTAALSNLVSNVPAVMLLKSLVPAFPNPHTGWLVLAMASTLAGNLTITGSVANMIVAERARDEVEIRFWDYFRAGLPISLLTLTLAGLWLWWIQ